MRKQFIALFFIILVASFLRFYQLGTIPAGLTNDEANTGYDAFSLLLTGRDQWNNFLPITNFIGFGDYPPPLYRYLSIVPISLFGLNMFSVRFISALSGVLSVVVLYFLIKKIFNQKAAIFSALSLAILPWSIGLSRVAIESNLAILFLITALYFGIALKSDKSIFFSVIFLVLSIFTYSAYTLFAPLVFLLILFFNYKKVKTKILLFSIILFLCLCLPLFVHKGAASTRFSQIGITQNINSIGLMNVLNDQRGQCLNSFNPLMCKLSENKPVLFTGVFFKNYLSHFSLNFLYAKGTVTQFSILEERGLDYLFCIIFLTLGLYFLIAKNKNTKISLVVILLFLFSAIPDSLTGDGNYSRASMMQPFIAILNGLGLAFLFALLNKIKNKNLKILGMFFIAFLIMFSISSFFVNYLTYFKNNYAMYSQYGYKNLMEYVGKVKNDYERIYISKHLNDTKQYIYYLFFNKYDPRKFQTKTNIGYHLEDNGWVSVDRIDNVYFVQNLPLISKKLTNLNNNILYISNPVDFPKGVKTEFITKDKLENVIFKAVKKENLIEYYQEFDYLNE
ncbi:MAG: glycosyltransferase family 39 protein [Candidatus Levyibacteriota bacterium]